MLLSCLALSSTGLLAGHRLAASRLVEAPTSCRSTAIGMLEASELKLGDQVRVLGEDDYPLFFHVPGHKGGFCAKGMVGTVERVYLSPESDNLDRSDERDVIVAFTEPKKWKAHFMVEELEAVLEDAEAASPSAGAPASAANFVPAELECDTRTDDCDTVAQFMRPVSEALVLEPSMPMLEAAKKLDGAGITGAPVAVDGKLVGVLTQFDFLYLERVADTSAPVATQLLDSGKWETTVRKSLASTVAGAMSKPTAILESSDMQQVAQLMLRRRFNHMPVVDSAGSGTLVGILTSQDVLRHVILRLSPDAAEMSEATK